MDSRAIVHTVPSGSPDLFVAGQITLLGCLGQDALVSLPWLLSAEADDKGGISSQGQSVL